MSSGKASVTEWVRQSLPEEMTWSGRPTRNDLIGLPGCPAVYLLLASADLPVHLATTQHLRRVMISRLTDPQPPRRGKVDLSAVVRGVCWRRVYSAFEARWWYYRLARRMYRKRYRRLISFGPAWFIHVDWQQPVPELTVTERVWQTSGQCVGPWVTHDLCQRATAGLCDAFDLCRYPEQVRRAPRGQRCAYAEMDRCDAPCDGSVPLERYVERCRAAWAFACGAVRPWIDAATARMKNAARDQQFELAGLLKKQIAWAWRWEDNWGRFVRPAEELNYLMVVPVARRRSWRVFLFCQGDLYDGPIVTDRQLARQAPKWLHQQLADRPAPEDAQIRTEQTWLVSHFLQSRDGDASIAVPLPAAEVPGDLDEWLQQRVAERRVTDYKKTGQ